MKRLVQACRWCRLWTARPYTRYFCSAACWRANDLALRRARYAAKAGHTLLRFLKLEALKE